MFILYVQSVRQVKRKVLAAAVSALVRLAGHAARATINVQAPAGNEPYAGHKNEIGQT